MAGGSRPYAVDFFVEAPTVTLALLLAQDSSRGNPAASLLLFAPLILLFYFMLIRPQRNRARHQASLLQALQIGDEVETIGGIFGTIRRMQEDVLWLEISAGTTVKISRGAVRRKIVEEPDAGS